VGKSSSSERDAANVTSRDRFSSMPTLTSPVGIGGARFDEVLLNPGLEQTFYDVDVAPGTSRIEVNIATERSDVDISVLIINLQTVFRRYGFDSATVAYDFRHGGSKSLTLLNPKPGKYKICLDPVNVTKEGTRLSYSDILYRTSTARQFARRNLRSVGDAAQELRFSTPPARRDGRRWVEKIGIFVCATGRCQKSAGVKLQVGSVTTHLD